MRRFALTLACALSFLLSAFGQEQSLQFYYIMKDHHIKVNPLVEEIQDIYDFARVDRNSAAIFYLANWDEPIVVKLNLPGDNRNDMDKIFEALMTKSETTVNPSSDLETISGLFDDLPLVKEDGTKAFSRVEFNYYVTPSFWDLSYNEQIVAALYFVMDMDADWARNYVFMSILHQEGDGLSVNEDQPFGPADLPVGYKFQVLTY